MKKIIQIKKDSAGEFFVFWELLDFCNQSCSYCPPNLHDGKRYYGPNAPTNEEIDIFLSTLNNISKSKNIPLRVVVSGGEPTLHPKLPDIITKIKSYGGHVTIATNGTRNVSYWKELTTLPDQVVISIHPEYYEAKQNRINELANFLNGTVNFFFYLLAQPAKWDTVLMIIDELDNKFKPLVELKMVHNKNSFNREMYQYTDEQLMFIKNYPTKLNYTIDSPKCSTVYSDSSSTDYVSTGKIISNGHHYFLNWMCGLGINNIAVYPGGGVYGAVCGATRLGRLSNFKLKDEYTKCPRPSCTCPTDITIDKYSPTVGTLDGIRTHN